MNQDGFEEIMPSKREKHPHRKDYTDLERDAAMEAYIRCAGHREKAAALLKEAGLSVPAQTIYDWAKNSDTERLARVREEIGDTLAKEHADMHNALGQAAGQIEAKAMTLLAAKLDADEVEAKDLSAVMQRSAIATGIHGEKHLLFSGRPTQIVQRNVSEVLRKLQSRGIAIDATTAED